MENKLSETSFKKLPKNIYAGFMNYVIFGISFQAENLTFYPNNV